MEFKIPKRFKLMGQTIEVVWQKDLVQRDDVVGFAVYRENKIILQSPVDGIKITTEQAEETFFHELFHFIFFKLGEVALRKNEKLIDQISGLLHQALRSAN